MMPKASKKPLEEDDDESLKNADLYELSKENKKKKTKLDFSIGLQRDRTIQTNLAKERAVHFHVTQDDDVGTGESGSEKSHDSDALLSDEETDVDRVNDSNAKENENVVNAEAGDGILCPDSIEVDDSAVVVSEEVSSANFIAIVQKCQSGLHLFNEIQTLPNSGSKLGVSLTMNRGIKALATLKKIDAEAGNVTWGKCKKNLREKLVKIFSDVVPATQDWMCLTTAILEPFVPKKVIVKKNYPIRNGDVR
jgi:hypothetical protein